MTSNFRGRLVHAHYTVSYTHLDVYKRQLLTDAVRARAAELAGTLPGVADLLGKIAAGVAVEGMESLTPVLVDGMESLLDVLPRGSVSYTHLVHVGGQRPVRGGDPGGHHGAGRDLVRESGRRAGEGSSRGGHRSSPCRFGRCRAGSLRPSGTSRTVLEGVRSGRASSRPEARVYVLSLIHI